VGGPDDIHLKREPANAAWKLAGANIVDGAGEFVVGNPTPSGELLIIRDNCTKSRSYCYTVTVTVTVNGTTETHTSPDPQIVNSPSGIVSSPLYALVGAVVGAVLGALIDANTGPVTSRGMLKGLLAGAVLGAIVGVLLGRMLAGRRRP
jgi:uncharacterized membrane protein YeaQ/YmgE (transglycosylase-associated protein family)